MDAPLPNAPKPVYRRHIYVIDKEFQYRFLSTWMMMTVGFILIVAALLYAGLAFLQGGGQESMKLGVLRDLLVSNAVFVILLTMFLALYLLLLSHRLAGPAYRMTKSLERMLAGDYEFAVVLRQKDYLKDVAQGLNALLKDLQERQVQVRQALDESARLNEAMKTQGASPEFQASAARVTELLSAALRKRETGIDSQIQTATDAPPASTGGH